MAASNPRGILLRWLSRTLPVCEPVLLWARTITSLCLRLRTAMRDHGVSADGGGGVLPLCWPVAFRGWRGWRGTSSGGSDDVCGAS